MGKVTKAEQELLEEAAGWILKLENTDAESPLRKEFDAWLAQCEENRVAWARVNETWTFLGAVQPAYNQNVWGVTPPKAKASIPSSSPAISPVQTRRSYRRPVATVIAALAAAWILWIAAPAIFIALQADHRTAVGQIERVRMADGSTVELGGSSAIKTDIGAVQRKVTLLAGEAFFDVASDKSRPFVVNVQGVEIKVLGTAFDVQVSSSQTSVALLRGSVDAMPADRKGEDVVLKPGEMLVVDRDTGAVSISTIPLEDIGAWRNGKVFLANTTVGTAIEMIQRYHPAWIAIPDTGLAKRNVSGLFDLRDPDKALAALVEPFGGKVRAITPLARIVTRL